LTARTSVVLLVFTFCVLSATRAQDCKDWLLVDATQRVADAGIDTSGRWWALTQPFETLTNLVVDGKVYGPYEFALAPKFSYDGSTFIAGFRMLGQWYVLTEDDTLALHGDSLVATFLPSNSSTPWWYHENGSDRRLSTFDRSYRCANVPLRVCFHPDGEVAVWVERRGANDVILINGKEHLTADQILLGGVSSLGQPIFAVRYGTRWSVYRGSEELISSLASLSEFRVDALGANCAWIASDGSGIVRIYLHAPDMIAPWTSMPVQSAQGLCLAPSDPFVASRTVRNGNNVVNFNGAEYPSGRQTGPIGFSHNGLFLGYAGLDGDFFVTINGKRHWVKSAVNLSSPLHIATDGLAVGWASATTLAYVNLEHNVLRLGRMCDTMGPVVYDRRSRTFKGLGFVSGRLFMLECDPR